MKTIKLLFSVFLISIIISITSMASIQSTPSDADYKTDLIDAWNDIKDIWRDMPTSISINEVPNKEEARKFLSKYYSDELVRKHDLDIIITYYDYAFSYSIEKEGQFLFTGLIKFSLDKKSQEKFDQKLEECKVILNNLQSRGIYMSEANSMSEIRKYVQKLLPVSDNLNISVSIYNSPTGISDEKNMKPATQGSYLNKTGTYGYCYIGVYLQHSVLTSKHEHINPIKVLIIPTPYSEYNSEPENNDNDYYSVSKKDNLSNEMIVNKPSLYSGKWEHIGNNWKLKIEGNSYATSQWAKINNLWYLFGSDGNMVTGWEKVNGKWYFMEPSGEMVTGWKWISGKCYYMDESGSMLSNAITPDGYKVNENGEWVH